MSTDSTRHEQSPWLNSLLYQQGKFILAIPVSCLIASLGAFGWLQYKSGEAEDWVQHTQQVRLEGKRLFANLLDAETEVRGYELTSRGEFLTRYQSARAEIPKNLDQLEQLVSDNPSQSQRLQQIRALAQARMTFLERNLQLVKTQRENLTSPKFAALVLESKQTMDATRAQIDRFLAEEERLQRKRDERSQVQRDLTWLVLCLSAAIGIGGSLFAAYLLNRLERKLIERDRKLRESEAQYRAVVENFPNGSVLLYNSELRYLLADGLGLATLGLSKQGLEGKAIGELFPAQTNFVLEPIYRQALAGEATTTEIPYDSRTYIVHALPVRNASGEIFAGMVVTQDITELKQSQAELRRVNRALQTLSECNQALVRATDESTLLQDICRNIVEFGGYHSAWIGYAEHDEAKTVRPLAQVGFEQGYLEFQDISWCITRNGSSPVGTAIRTNSPQIFQNVLTDPCYSRWREAAMQRGYAASITLPLIANAQPLGALSIYSSEPEAFDEAEVRLLTELANDLAYGITALRTREQRQQAEEALRNTNQTLQALIQASPLAIVSMDTDGTVKTWNEAAQRIFGWSASEAIGKQMPIIPGDRQDEFRELRQRVLQGESITELETLRQKRDGTLINASSSFAPLSDARGRSDGLMAMIADITSRKQAEESLRDSEAKFRAFLESASEAIIVSNANGEIVIFNAKAEELFGYDQTEVLGRSVEFLMPQRYRQSHLGHRDSYQANPSNRSMGEARELFAQRKDGTEFPIAAGLSSVQTNDGTFVMTFLTDITERKQAEDEIRRLNESLKRHAREIETRYEQIVELAEEGIWVIDDQAKTTYVNQALTKMLGYTEKEMVGRSMFDFMDEAARSYSIANFEHQKQGTAEKREFKLKAKNGRNVWTYMSTSPVTDENGKMLWACALVYDITERKQAEEQLRSSSERISLANAELARATRLKDEFLAGMSHELRTPLNAILGLSEALQEEVYGELTPKQQQSLATIEQSGRHLLELINDILDLSKIESGKMELQLYPVSVETLCESSLTFVKQQAHKKNIQLRTKIAEGIGDIEVDERRLRQVLVNLLSNAVKFTPEGGEVRLEVDADTEAETIHISVIDTGIGIAKENMDRLFKPFVQLDSSLSRRYAGTGLGLALARRIVELHGGSISLESELAKGSRFTVSLPWKEPDGSGQSIGDTELVNVQLPNIRQVLVVEDSEPAASHVARYIAELGAAVKIQPQGEGSVEAALQCQPDVIILDILLPNLSGWEVLAQLKANPATQHVPVLVASVVDERSQAMAMGASDYLLKPISRSSLQSALARIFSASSESPGQAASVETPQPQRQAPQILLAEDNEANISTLVDYLQVQGYQVILARNGVEAVYVATQKKPDLILMDIQRPEMDGFEATRRIREKAELANVPIIALTALAMPGDRDRCLAAGANDYLTKPVGLKKLANTIAQYLKR